MIIASTSKGVCMFYDPETNNGAGETGKTAVFFQGVTMNFRDVFAQSEYVRSTVQHLQNIWRKRGICELDLVEICTRQTYPPEEKTRYEQPVIFTVSLARFWELEKKTCESQVLVGHSFGEYTALCAASVYTPEDGYRIVQERGYLTAQANREFPGLMAAVSGEINVAEIEELCEDYGVDIGNVNSSEQVVLSGEKRGVERVCEHLEKRGLRVTKLNTGCPFHSRRLERIQPIFRNFLDSIPFRAPRPDQYIVMNATARTERDPGRIKDCLARQLTDPVDFPRVVKTMDSLGVTRIEEIGSRNVLKGFVKKILRKP